MIVAATLYDFVAIAALVLTVATGAAAAFVGARQRSGRQALRDGLAGWEAEAKAQESRAERLEQAAAEATARATQLESDLATARARTDLSKLEQLHLETQRQFMEHRNQLSDVLKDQGELLRSGQDIQREHGEILDGIRVLLKEVLRSQPKGAAS